MLALPFLLDIVPGVLTEQFKQEKEVKLSLFGADTLLCIENPKIPPKTARKQ